MIKIANRNAARSVIAPYRNAARSVIAPRMSPPRRLRKGEYFVGVTNQLLSSGQPLPWINVGGGGN